MMVDALDTLLEQLVAQGLPGPRGQTNRLGQFKAGDTLVLDDATLQAAIARSHPLSRSEYAALIGSPLTLRRLAVLVDKQNRQTPAASAAAMEPATAANDALWSGSQCTLRAADSGAPAPSLTSADGWWLLAFLRSELGYQMVLRVDPQAPFAQSLIDGGVEVAVRDGQGGTILKGRLDQDGELEAQWGFDASPNAHIVAAGGKIFVQRT